MSRGRSEDTDEIDPLCQRERTGVELETLEGLVESLFKKEPAKGILSVFFDRVENLSLSSAGFDSIDFAVYTASG